MKSVRHSRVQVSESKEHGDLSDWQFKMVWIRATGCRFQGIMKWI